jgi:hypothetical protein
MLTGSISNMELCLLLAVALKVSDIDSERMLLRIKQGKGRKDRLAMPSPRLLELLRDWYRIARPAVWLFPGRDPLLPLTTRQFNRVSFLFLFFDLIVNTPPPERRWLQITA